MQQRAPGAQPGPRLRTLGSCAQLRAFSGSGLSVGHASGPPVLPRESRPFSTSAQLPHVVLDHRPPLPPASLQGARVAAVGRPRFHTSRGNLRVVSVCDADTCVSPLTECTPLWGQVCLALHLGASTERPQRPAKPSKSRAKPLCLCERQRAGAQTTVASQRGSLVSLVPISPWAGLSRRSCPGRVVGLDFGTSPS